MVSITLYAPAKGIISERHRGTETAVTVLTMARHLPERTVSICSTHRCHTIEAASIGIRSSRCCGMTRTHRLSYRLHGVYLG